MMPARGRRWRGSWARQLRAIFAPANSSRSAIPSPLDRALARTASRVGCLYLDEPQMAQIGPRLLSGNP